MTTHSEPSTITTRHVSLSAAERMITAGKQKADEIGIAAAIAVVDADGTLKAFGRMDGAALLPVRIAQQKAWTAISFGMSTKDWWDMVSNDPPLLHGIVHQEDVIVFPGGIPVTQAGEMIGGVGVSGGHYTKDHEIAVAALGAL